MLLPNNALHTREIDGVLAYIHPSPARDRGHGGLNGYCLFPPGALALQEPEYWGILSYVPVHGGITYRQDGPEGTIFGFDTAHCDSDEFPREDPEWIFEQCSIMIQGIKLAASLEAEYLGESENSPRKIAICEQLLALAPSTAPSMGVMINILSGRV